jgi:hypothetical protein
LFGKLESREKACKRFVVSTVICGEQSFSTQNSKITDSLTYIPSTGKRAVVNVNAIGVSVGLLKTWENSNAEEATREQLLAGIRVELV